MRTRAERTLTRKDISPEMLKRIHAAMWHTWSTIGADIDQGREYCGVTDPLTAEELAEVIMDADYIELYDDDTEAHKILRSLTFEEADALALEWAKDKV